MCIFHKWGKWKQYEEKRMQYIYKTGKTIDYVQKRQRRYCIKCNKMQDEAIG